MSKMTSISWTIDNVVKFRHLFSRHRVSRIVSSVEWRAVKTRSVMLCCRVIDVWTTSNEV